MQYESPITSILSFSKVGQTSRSQGKKLWYQVKGLVIRNTHMKYENFVFNGLKVMAKVKVFVYKATPTLGL